MTTTQPAFVRPAFVRLAAESAATADVLRRLIAVLDDLEAQGASLTAARKRERALWSAYRAKTRRRNRRR